jgi:small multidrug resistance pump
VRVIPVGIVYAIWSGVGIALIALVGWLVLDQKLDMPAIAGIVMITSGVMVISLFSGSMHE